MMNFVLYNGTTPWSKKGNIMFDIALGSLDGAETFEITGLFLLKDLVKLGQEIGLYRDDGLCACALTARETTNFMKKSAKFSKATT